MSFTYPKLRLGKSIGKKLRPIPCGGATCAIMQCSVVRMVWLIYYRESHSGRLVRKSMKFWWFLKGNIVTSIAGNTFSGQGMLFGTFLMKNIFIDFPTPILKHNFCMISSKNSMIFIGFICTIMMYSPKLYSKSLHGAARDCANFERTVWSEVFIKSVVLRVCVGPGDLLTVCYFWREISQYSQTSGGVDSPSKISAV